MIMFTVLILEDDYEQQKAVSKIINEHYKDWQIFIAGTYKEACNLTSTKCFDLFLLDIELKHENEKEKITLKDSNGVYLHLLLDDIDYIESTSKETVVYTHDANIKLTNMTINELLDIFPDNFIQCHRKYIVNLHHFYSYDKSTFIIQVGKHSIPLGRKHKKDIEERLHLI